MRGVSLDIAVVYTVGYCVSGLDRTAVCITGDTAHIEGNLGVGNIGVSGDLTVVYTVVDRVVHTFNLNCSAKTSRNTCNYLGCANVTVVDAVIDGDSANVLGGLNGGTEDTACLVVGVDDSTVVLAVGDDSAAAEECKDTARLSLVTGNVTVVYTIVDGDGVLGSYAVLNAKGAYDTGSLTGSGEDLTAVFTAGNGSDVVVDKSF